MKTTLMTFLRVAGSIGAAILVFVELDAPSMRRSAYGQIQETQVWYDMERICKAESKWML
jgi:hypothetical protein